MGIGGEDDLAAVDDFAGGEGDTFSSNSADGAVKSDGFRRESVGELLRDGLHASGGERGASLGKHAEGELEHFARGAEFVLEKDATVEGSEKGIDHARAEAKTGEEIGSGLIGRSAGAAEDFKAEEGHTDLIGEGADGSEGAAEKTGGATEDVHDAVELLAVKDERTGLEGLKVERGKV